VSLIFAIEHYTGESRMISIWANLGLLAGAAILAGAAWLLLFIVGKVVFEDMIGGLIRKIRAKIKKDKYIY
jgi:hypothetical protein